MLYRTDDCIIRCTEGEGYEFFMLVIKDGSIIDVGSKLDGCHTTYRWLPCAKAYERALAFCKKYELEIKL